MREIDEGDIQEAAEEYEIERDLWGCRTNKFFRPVRYEVIRVPEDGNPTIEFWSEDREQADYEMKQLRMKASLKKALDFLRDKGFVLRVPERKRG